MKLLQMIFAALVFMCLVIFTPGCEYDVAEPKWEKEQPELATPAITAIDPPQAATPGVNAITIHGENFAVAPDSNKVYFDNVAVEIFESSATSITVSRPNLVSDAAVVKVAPNNGLIVAKMEPYRIDPVLETTGFFLENLELSVVAVDQAENIYVVESSSRNVVKGSPSGERTVLGQASRDPYDAVIGPDGRLYLPQNNRAIDVVDTQTGAVSEWVRMPPGKVVRFGDFDAEGYFYTGGSRSGLMIVAPDLTITDSNFYPSPDIIQAIRVFNGYVYVAVSVDVQSPPAIWRHAISTGGVPGGAEAVLDFATLPERYAARTLTALTVSSDGTVFLATDAPNPILRFQPATSNLETFYTGILPDYAKHINWGPGNSIYLLSGDTAAQEEWNVYRVDMGTTSGARF